MDLSTEFIRLPLTVDAERLAAEVAAFAENHWRPHPQGHPGNSALPLISAGGDPANVWGQIVLSWDRDVDSATAATDASSTSVALSRKAIVAEGVAH